MEEESLMLNPLSFPEEKFTEDGKSYYYTRGDGTPITNESWSLKDLAYPLNVPFGGKRQGNLSDWSFTNWLVNAAPGQLAPIGAAVKGIKTMRNQHRTSPHGFYKEDSVDVKPKTYFNKEKLLTDIIDNRMPRLTQGEGLYDPKVYIPPNELIGTQKGDPLQSVNPDQLEFFGDEEAISKNLPEFITYPMKKDMPAYSKEVPEGYFDYHKMKNWFYASETGGRKAIETGMTPVVPGTQISRGISFSGLAKAQLPKLRKNFAPILKALKIDQKESASIHHIAALKATYGILHKVQVDSPLFREVYDVLLEHIPGLGNMKGNLVPVIGMTKGKKQVSTPHNIVHRFYSDKIGESGELFFTDEVLERMVHDKAFRIEKAHELGRFIARSEKIVKDAQQIWRIAFSQEKINFNEIVNRLSELDELGYSKLADIEYQTPALSEMIKDIVLDIKLEKDQLKRLTPQSEDFSDIGKANVVKEGTLEEERQRLKRIRQNKSKHKPQKGQFSFDFLNDIFD